MQYLRQILQWARPLIIYYVWYITWKVATCSLPELTSSSRNLKMNASSCNTWNQLNASSILELHCTMHEVTVVEIVHHFHQQHLVHSVTIYSSQEIFGGTLTTHVNFIRKKLNETLKPLDCLGFHRYVFCCSPPPPPPTNRMPNFKSLRSFLPSAWACEKISIKMHS